MEKVVTEERERKTIKDQEGHGQRQDRVNRRPYEDDHDHQ